VPAVQVLERRLGADLVGHGSILLLLRSSAEMGGLGGRVNGP
jgi:hypothetical protein